MIHQSALGVPNEVGAASPGASAADAATSVRRHGVAALPAAFPASWADELAEDFHRLLRDALNSRAARRPEGPIALF
jgi:hypothetical protein